MFRWVVGRSKRRGEDGSGSGGGGGGGGGGSGGGGDGGVVVEMPTKLKNYCRSRRANSRRQW